MDVSSSSEQLLNAKESLRASVMRSVDGSQDIYAVQFSPATWANYLTTDFEPIDLLMSPELLRQQLVDKEESRRSLLNRLGVLKTGQNKMNIDDLQKKADTARTAYNVCLFPTDLCCLSLTIFPSSFRRPRRIKCFKVSPIPLSPLSKVGLQ